MTKKVLVLLLTCVLCGTSVFAGCLNASHEKTDEASESKVTENEGTEVEPVETEAAETEVSQADIEKNIIGKWINAESEIAVDGDALCDDEEGNTSTAEYVPDRSAQKHQSPQEQTEGYYWYEAVFLDAEEVEQVFSMESDDYPNFEFVPESFHVTTQFKPETKNEDLYGTPVTIHIIGYASGSVQDTQENITSNNEGLLVELSSTDEMMQALIDNYDKTYHITGSYSVGAKYTEQLDFSNVTPIDITIEGVFGMADSNGTVILEHQG